MGVFYPAYYAGKRATCPFALMCYNQMREEALTVSEFKYLSPEWAQEAAKRLKEQITPERMRHLTSSMLTVYTNLAIEEI